MRHRRHRPLRRPLAGDEVLTCNAVSLRGAWAQQLSTVQQALDEADADCRALRDALHRRECERTALLLEQIRLYGLVEEP